MLLILIRALFTCMHGIATERPAFRGGRRHIHECAFWTLAMVIDTLVISVYVIDIHWHDSSFACGVWLDFFVFVWRFPHPTYDPPLRNFFPDESTPSLLCQAKQSCRLYQETVSREDINDYICRFSSLTSTSTYLLNPFGLISPEERSH